MPRYVFNVLDSGVLYELTLDAKHFRADSSGKVGFFDHAGNLIRMFESDEIMVDSIKKVNMEEESG